jgi:small subunit ribosomal protein S8
MDTIANMLTSLLNAQKVGKPRIYVPYSRFSEALAHLLRDKGYVAKVDVKEEMPKRLVITLLYKEGKPVLTHVRRLSKLGRRRYVKHTEIPYAADGYGLVLLSTSQGVMDDSKARKEALGGELICEIW